MSETLWLEKEIALKPKRRGVHLVTNEIMAQLHEMERISTGLANFLLLHTSAGLALNERVEPEVLADLDRFLDGLVPQGQGLYQHAYEGPDDMPAHIKSVITGASLTLPISNGSLRLGVWQGVHLCEFRDRGGVRRIHVTLQGAYRNKL